MEKSKIENIFNECLENLISGKETVEQCLQRYPDQARELEPLLHTALSLNEAVDIKPAPEVKARIRDNLQRKMAEAGVPRRASWFSLQPRWALSAVAIMLIFVIGGSAVLAADSSMPGSPFYPVKLLTENISLKLAGSDAQKVELSLTFADRRITEMNYMLENGTSNAARVDEVSNSYIAYVNQVSNFNYSGQAQAETVLGTASAETSAQESTEPPTVTSGITATPPPETQKSTEPPPEITLEIPPERTADASLQAGSSEEYKLNSMIQYYAYNHPKQLEKWLKDPSIPESYKITIRRMLQDVQNLKR